MQEDTPSKIIYVLRFSQPLGIEKLFLYIPMGFSFRPPKGLRKLISKKPLVTLTVGQPLYPDKTLPQNEAIDKLHAEAYHAVQGLCGIHPGDPTYNTDQNIDNYKSTM